MSSRTFSVILSARVDQFKAAMREAQGATDKLTKEGSAGFQKFGAQATQVGGWMASRLTLPLVAAGGAAVKMGVDFDSSMTRIQSLVGLSAGEVDGLRDSVMALSGQTAAAPRELADALFFATSAGLDAATALEAVEWAAKASAVGLGSTATVVDLTSSAMNAYGSDVLNAAEATDVLTAAVRYGKLEPDQLAGAMGRVLPIASAMGVEFHEVGAAFAAMSRTGTSANEAATQLRGIMASLLSPSSSAKEALEGVGLSVEGIQTSLRDDGLLATLELLVSSLGDNAMASEAVFGNIRALSGVMDMLGGNVEATRQIFGDMTDTAGITAEAFDVVSETAGFKLKQAFADLQASMVQAGQILLPFVSLLAEGIGSLAGAFGNLPGPAQTMIVVLLGMVAAAGPLLMLFGSLIRNIGMLIPLLGALKAAMIGHPLLTAAVAIGAVASAFWVMGQRVDESKKAIKDLAEAMRNADSPLEAFTQHLMGIVRDEDLLRSAMQSLRVTTEQLAAAALEGGERWETMRNAIVSAATEINGNPPNRMWIELLDQLGASGREAVVVMEELNDVNRQTADNAQDLIQSYIDQGIAARQAADATREKTDTDKDAEEQTKRLAEANEAAARRFEKMVDEIERASNDLRSSVEAAFSSASNAIFSMTDKAKTDIRTFTDELILNAARTKNWQDALIAIAEATSAEFATHLASMGLDAEELVNDLADPAKTAELEGAFQAWVGATEVAQRDMAEEFAKVDPAFKKVLEGLDGMTRAELAALAESAHSGSMTIGAQIAAGIAAGLRGHYNAIASAAIGAVQHGISAAQYEAGIRSPSRLFAEQVGKPIAEGIALGIVQNIYKVEAAAEAALAAALDKVKVSPDWFSGGGPSGQFSGDKVSPSWWAPNKVKPDWFTGGGPANSAWSPSLDKVTPMNQPQAQPVTVKVEAMSDAQLSAMSRMFAEEVSRRWQMELRAA